VTTGLTLRRFAYGDEAGTRAVFHDAVHGTASAFYGADERAAWSPSPEPPETWRDRLADHISYVAEKDGCIVGFASLNHSGYFDLLYVASAHGRRGIAGHLYDQILADPRAEMKTLETEASQLSLGFFQKRGWKMLHRQTVVRRGIEITNFKMALTRSLPLTQNTSGVS